MARIGVHDHQNTHNELKRIVSKDTFLSELANSKAIIFVVAHADGCHVKLPSGETIDIVPEDIAKLKFVNNPFVMLRICNGIDNGYADAFIEAGASAVWANRGKISAKSANEQIDTFADSLKNGKSIQQAINDVKDKYVEPRFNTDIFVETSSPSPKQLEGKS